MNSMFSDKPDLGTTKKKNCRGVGEKVQNFHSKGQLSLM